MAIVTTSSALPNVAIVLAEPAPRMMAHTNVWLPPGVAESAELDMPSTSPSDEATNPKGDGAIMSECAVAL